jgi:hypothetical protein
MTSKELHVGDLPFTEIIDRKLLYADKTKYIYDLLRPPEKSYFLSRPRRFGKSLLLSTLNELFSGNRERFIDLWIGRSDYAFPKYPVIFLDFSFESNGKEILEQNTMDMLEGVASSAELAIKAKRPNMFLRGLVKALSGKHDSQVVILIDECDAPVTRNMGNLEIAQANANFLHDFFSVLKTLEYKPLLRFTFVTGITRYGLASADSGPNHLTDISLDPRYEGICGFTLDEFETLFADLMEPTLNKLKKQEMIKPTADLDYLWGQSRIGMTVTNGVGQLGS